jgi:catechol 2,3-dioxygenase-like lactoylglutathione lyase family enzyme
MELGAFSISLTVKDIQASKDFYDKLGFTEFGGDITQNWLILKNGTTVIGLFQGMFDKNSLTFNPGWDGDAQALDSFTDVRDLIRPRQFYRPGPGRKPDPGRSTRLSCAPLRHCFIYENLISLSGWDRYPDAGRVIFDHVGAWSVV